MNRPLGIKIIGWWFVIGGALSILAMALLSAMPQKDIDLSASDILFSAAVSVAVIIAGTGLLRVKKWAWFAAVALEAMPVIFQSASLVFLKKGLTPQQMTGTILGISVCALIIAYLMRGDVRELYRITKPPA